MNVPLKMKLLETKKKQIHVAYKVGISEPVLSKIIQGWIEPDEKIKKRIARELRCEVEEIFPIKE